MTAANSSSESRFEIITVVLLGLSALITAWASFQSSLWGGVSTDQYALADLKQVEVNTLREAGLSVFQEDQSIVFEYTKATKLGDPQAATIIKRDIMSKRVRDAVDAYERSPAAGRDASVLSDRFGYVLPTREMTATRNNEARLALDAARDAGRRGDQYNLAAVLLAGALFLLGISSTLRIPRLRIALMGIGGAILLGTCVWMATLPLHNPL